MGLTFTQAKQEVVAILLMEVQALKTLVLVSEHKVDGAH